MNRLEAGQDSVIWWIWNAWIISCGWGWGGGHALHRGPLITPSLLHPHTRRGGTVWEKAAVLIWEVGRIIFLAHSGEWWWRWRWRLRHFIMMKLCLCWSSSWSSWWQTVEAGDEKDGDHHVGRRSRQVWCVDGLACGASLPPAQTELLKKSANKFFLFISRPVVKSYISLSRRHIPIDGVIFTWWMIIRCDVVQRYNGTIVLKPTNLIILCCL